MKNNKQKQRNVKCHTNELSKLKYAESIMPFYVNEMNTLNI